MQLEARSGAVAAALAAVGTALVNSRSRPRCCWSDRGGACGRWSRCGDRWIGRRVGRLGIPEERIKHYEAGVKNGGILMGVRAKNADDAAHFEREWKAGDGEYVYR